MLEEVILCGHKYVHKSIGGQAPSAHGRGSTFFSARGGSIFSKQGGVRGGVPWKKNSLEFLKSAIRAEKLLQK